MARAAQLTSDNSTATGAEVIPTAHSSRYTRLYTIVIAVKTCYSCTFTNSYRRKKNIHFVVCYCGDAKWPPHPGTSARRSLWCIAATSRGSTKSLSKTSKKTNKTLWTLTRICVHFQGKGQHFNISKNGNLQTSFGPLDASEADFSSGAEEETSGYESERSLSPPPAARDAAAGRRPRTAFTAEQIGSLERAFKRNAYLGTRDKAELCEKLRLSDKQIRNWFQNRRMKLKRTAQDALAHAWQASAASHFAHYPAELRAYRPAAYGRYRSPASPPRDASAAAFARPPHDVQYASVALPLDSLFQYGAAPPPPLPLAGSYPAYPPYY
ncbi:ventrally expressed dharma/bozozok antagonist isoform X1 [Phycodurus eques]|uniref:ventrally expressed dharma/bozozok antagonist isoform X1 n=1 Tax=Phycodurus eques TaxID=693459 RepID=UPI002ACE3242|nr:ventrally expressed dharma/bozozok antagonist isoform X1 [Phycodurus eques]